LARGRLGSFERQKGEAGVRSATLRLAILLVAGLLAGAAVFAVAEAGQNPRASQIPTVVANRVVIAGDVYQTASGSVATSTPTRVAGLTAASAHKRGGSSSSANDGDTDADSGASHTRVVVTPRVRDDNDGDEHASPSKSDNDGDEKGSSAGHGDAGGSSKSGSPDDGARTDSQGRSNQGTSIHRQPAEPSGSTGRKGLESRSS
jgi:hypothetical protein